MKKVQTKNINFLFSNKDIAKLIFPVLIEQFLAMLVGMADSVMISKVGEAAVSAVSLVDSVNILIINLFAAIATGGAVVAGQFLGSKRAAKQDRVTDQLVIVVLLLSLAITAVLFLFRNLVLDALYSSVTPEVMNYARTYLTITVFSIPFIALYNAGAAIFRTMSDSRTPMLISLLMNAVNISGNAILIYGLHMEVEGAAIPTLISRAVAAIVILVLLRSDKRVLHISKPFHLKLEKCTVRRILGIGIPNGIENSMFQFGKIIVASLIAGFGTTAITANAVGNAVGVFQIIAGFSVSIITVPIIARCYGAGDEFQVRYYAVKLMKLTYIMNIAINIILVLLFPLILTMYNLSPETGALTNWVLLFSGAVSVLFWPTSFMLPNVFRATSDVKYTMIVSIVSMWMWRVGGSYFFGEVLGFGLKGVWFGMLTDWVFRGIFFVARYNGKHWRRKILMHKI